MEPVFKGLKENLEKSFDFSDVFKESLEKDKDLIKEYFEAISDGVDETEAKNKLEGATEGAFSFIDNKTIDDYNNEKYNIFDDFDKQQKIDNVKIEAANTSFMNGIHLLNEYKSALGGVGANTGLTQEDLMTAFEGSNRHLANFIKTTDKGNLTWKNYAKYMLKAKASTIGMKVATTALNTAIMTIGTALAQLVIQGIVKLYDSFANAADNARQKLEDLKAEYDDNASKLKEYNSELETTRLRMHELLNMDSLSYTEQEELGKLRQSNYELEREISLLEQKQKLLKEEKALAFSDSAEKTLNSFWGSFDGLNGLDKFQYFFDFTTSKEDIINDKIQQYNGQMAQYDRILSGEYTEQTDQALEYWKTNAEKAKSYLIEQASLLQSAISGIEYGIDDTTDEWLDKYNNIIDSIYIAVGDESAKENAFSRLIDQTFDDVTKDLENLGEKGEATWKDLANDDGSVQEKYQDFIDNLVEIGYISGTTKSDLAQVARAFNALGEEATNSADSVEDAFQRWEDAQNAVQSGAQFDKALEAFNHVYDTVADKKSDLYGRIGNKDYKAAIELVIPDSAGIDISNPDAVKKYLSNNLKKYFVFDDDGNYAGANLTKFFEDSKAAGLMEYVKETDSWVVKGQQSLETWAEELNMTVPVVKALFGEANEFGGNFQFYELDDDLLTLATNAKNAKDALEETFGEKYSLKLDISEIEDEDEKINVLNQTIEEAQAIINTDGVDPTVANNARKVLEFALKQKQELEKPAVMFVDTTQIDDERVSSAIQKVQKYIEAKNKIELYTELGQPTPESVQNAYDSAIKALQNSEFLASIGFKIDEKSDKSIDEQIDEFIDNHLTKDNLTLELAMGGKFGLSDDIFQPALDAVETLAKKIDEIFNGERKLTFNAQLTNNGLELSVNTEDIEKAQGEAEQLNEDLGKTEYERNADVGTTKETKKSFNLIKTLLNNLLAIDENKFRSEVEIYTYLTQSEDEESDSSQETGTSLPQPVSNTIDGATRGAIGSKYRPTSSGVNGTAHANGNWGFDGGEALVGELGQELVVNPATSSWYTVGDHGAEFVNIPRNAIIFNHKQTESLLKNGYVTGRGRALVGGTALESEGSITGSMTTSDANRSSVSGGKSTTQKSSSKDDSTQTIDYIEILLERLSRALESFASVADDTSKSFSARNKAIENELKKTDELIKANEIAASVYLKEANSVKLSSSLKKKVREGDYDISDYDSDTAELINKYKELYDKYLNAADEAANQKTNKSALQMEKFELTQQKYDSKFDLQDAKVDYYENLDTKAELEGKGGSVSAQEKMISVYERRQDLLQKERAELEAMFNSGTIQKGTEAWYEMKTAIQENKSELIATENEISELNNRINEIQYERFNNIADSYENRITLKDNRISYHEALNQQAELEGKGGSTKAQETIISLNQDRAELLEKEREKLRDQLKNIKEGSDEWYEAKQKIQDINVDLVETENAILEGKENIENINWENFEKISTSYDGLDNEYEARIAYYEDSNTKHQLNGNQGSVYAQQKMMEWESSHISDLNTELEELYNERSKYSKNDANWDKMTSRIREVKDEIRDSENALLQYRNNALDILSGRFQDIDTLYDSKMSNLDHKINNLNNDMTALELQGYKVSAKYYEEQKKIEEDRVGVLNREIAELQDAFDNAMATGEIEKYSQEWYDYQLAINKANESLDETKNSLLEIDKTIRDLDYENFQYLRDTVSQLNDEADFYINLMSDSDMYDDKGNLTDEGMATLGLHGQNYNVYMSEAEEYGKKLAEVEKKLADDPNNTELIERKQEYIEAQRDSILAAQDEKQAMRELVEEGINYQLDALQELIDEYTEALDKAKDLHDYENKVSDHTSEISSLRKQISAYSGDDSQEAKLKVQQLQAELKEAEENLEETEYEKYIDDQKELLDEFYQSYEEILNSQLDEIDELIKGVTSSINENASTINETLNGLSEKFGIELSDGIKTIWGDRTFDDVLSSYIGDDENGVIGKQTSINQALKDIEIDVERILTASATTDENEVPDSNQNTNNSGVNTPNETPNIDVNTTDTNTGSQLMIPDFINKVIGGFANITDNKNNASIKDEDSEVLEDKGNISESETVHIGNIVDAGGAEVYHSPTDEIPFGTIRDVVDESDYYEVLTVNKQFDEDWLGIRVRGGVGGTPYWVKASSVSKVPTYKNGGFVDYTGLAWVDGTKSNPEYMLNAEDTANFLKLREDIEKLYSSGALGNVTPLTASSSDIFNDITRALGDINHNLVSKDTNMGDINITIPIERVQDYNDFVTQLKNDPKFDRLLKASTIDLLDGKSRLAKNRINWNK